MTIFMVAVLAVTRVNVYIGAAKSISMYFFFRNLVN